MKALCPYFTHCSGCSLQQFPYVKQLRDKTKHVREELSVFTPRGEPVEAWVHPIVPSPLEFGYRTSTKLCLHEESEGERRIGLYERRRKKVVAIPKCPVHHPAINELVFKLFGGKRPLPAPFYDHTRRGFQEGRLKFLTVRYCPRSDAFGIVLSHTGIPRAKLEAWAKKHDWTNISVYEATLTANDDGLVLPREVRHLSGKEFFSLSVAQRVFELDPLAFFQANHALLEAFVDEITAELSGKVLWDLYGGYGAYSIPIAGNFQKIHLVEANDKAIAAAKRQACENVETHSVSVESFLGRNAAGFREVTHIIVNPPRSGLSEKVRGAFLKEPLPHLKSLVYVSCNLATLKRDLFDLVQKGGYRLRKVMPFDMFPQTDHVELVVKLDPPRLEARHGHGRDRKINGTDGRPRHARR